MKPKLRTRIVNNHDGMFVRLQLLNGWHIDSVTEKLFYTCGTCPTDVYVVINNIEVPLAEVDTLQVDNIMFKKEYSKDVYGNYKWVTI